MTHPLQNDFRQAMSSCAAGVHVITTNGEAGRYGITMTAVASLTDTPPTLILAVNRQSQAYPILQKNGQLCVNVLNANQQDVAEHFAGLTELPPEERFLHHDWQHHHASQQLQLEGALAHLHGRIIACHEVGTHGVFYVEIDEINNHDQTLPALLYFRRSFEQLA